LALDYFNSHFVQKIPQVFPGDPQFLSETAGGGAGDLALRGRRPNPGFDIIYGHSLLVPMSMDWL
jgi:hypothetical protein